jgi:hypothetical protein
MGTNYGQICIVGVCLKCNDIKRIISPAEYVDEPRYDTMTGKQIKTERILKKREQYVYDVLGESYDDLYYVSIDGLKCRVDNDNNLFVGLEIGDNYDCGRVELLQGSYSLIELLEKAKEVSEKLEVPSSDIGIHFVTYVG